MMRKVDGLPKSTREGQRNNSCKKKEFKKVWDPPSRGSLTEGKKKDTFFD